MTTKQRLTYYGFGFGMGILILMIVFKNKSCKSLNLQKQDQINSKPMLFSDLARCKMANLKLSTIDFKSKKVVINFSKSDPNVEPRKYVYEIKDETNAVKEIYLIEESRTKAKCMDILRYDYVDLTKCDSLSK